MTASTEREQNITEVQIPGAPEIPGLRFRLIKMPDDFVGMSHVLKLARNADKLTGSDSPTELARAYSHLRNSDPATEDVVMVEVNGELVGYKRIEWWLESTGEYIYSHFGFLAPEWRGKGIGSALFRHSENHLRKIARRHPADAAHLFDSGAQTTQPGLISLLEGAGYKPVRYFYEMKRPNLENIPDIPMPEGLEVRPVKPEHYRAIWEAEAEAFRDHWGYSEPIEGDFERFLNDSPFQPELWQVAWDGDQVAGMVRTFISESENERMNRKRGYTENISTRRPWRKRGLAHALMARSLRVQKELGMTESALGVDTENPSGALRIYLEMGFEPETQGASYRKPVDL